MVLGEGDGAQNEINGDVHGPAADESATDVNKPTSVNRERTISKIIKKQQKIFKVIVIGDSNVGKTCLTYRFCTGKFHSKVEATIGVDFREKSVEVEEEKIKLQLWDTAGQERFRKSMIQHYYRNAHAVVYVYDVTKASSFHSLPMWIEECNRHQLAPNIPRILVGNKCDCTSAVVISTNMAQRFADIHGMPLFETSAKDDVDCDHVESIFMTLAHKLKSSKPMMPSPYGYSLAESGDASSQPVILPTAEDFSRMEEEKSCGC